MIPDDRFEGETPRARRDGMASNPAIRAALAVVAAAAIGVGGYWLGSRHGSNPATPASGIGAGDSTSAGGVARAAATDAGINGPPPSDASGRKVLYWYDPMAPQHRFDKPGKSPFMDMELVPRYADEVDEGGVAVSSRLQQSLGLRTVEVLRARIEPRFAAVGNVTLDERSIVVVAARTAGIVERLAVRAAGDPVRRGQAVATLYVPEWAAAQAEYLAIRDAGLASGDALVRAARERLKIAFMPEDVIARVEATGAPQPRVGLVSPIDGFVAEVMAREGAQVAMGMPVLRLASLATVWVQIDVPESQAALARPGLPVEARSPAFPGRKFAGRIETILPEVEVATRTLKARVVLKNGTDALRPGMYATVDIAAGAGARESLVVPQDAVIATGQRTVVIVAEAEGRFRPVEVEVGRDQGDDVEIVSGLSEGQKVVASGQFLIDSEASLRSALPRIAGAVGDAATATAAAPAGTTAASASPSTGSTGSTVVAAAGTAGRASSIAAHRAEGTLDALDAKALTITHGPVPALKWPGMTMDFRAPAGGVPAGLKPGDPIRFEFVKTPDDDWQVTRIERAGATAAAGKSAAAAPTATKSAKSAPASPPDPHAGH